MIKNFKDENGLEHENIRSPNLTWVGPYGMKLLIHDKIFWLSFFYFIGIIIIQQDVWIIGLKYYYFH